MQQQLQNLEAEIAHLQIELRQVRQLIGSLIRTEQNTMQMIRNQQAMGHQPMMGTQQMGGNQPMMGNQMGSTRQTSGTQQSTTQQMQQYLQEEMQSPQQFQRMRNLADRMDGQLRQLTESYLPNAGYRGTGMNPMTPMRPGNNDPMQNQY